MSKSLLLGFFFPFLGSYYTSNSTFESRYQEGKHLLLDVAPHRPTCSVLQRLSGLFSSLPLHISAEISKCLWLAAITIWSHYCPSFCEPKLDLADSTSTHQYFQSSTPSERIRFPCPVRLVMPMCFFQPETLKSQGPAHRLPSPPQQW